MINPIQINVSVELSASPVLVSLLQSIIPQCFSPCTESERIFPVAEAAEANIPATSEQEQPVKAEPDSPALETPAAPPTTLDVRAAMHQVRLRIEGADYETNKESDNVKRYHRSLTALFKRMAETYGSDKPSTLAEDKRQLFINECSQIIISDAGELTIQIPF